MKTTSHLLALPLSLLAVGIAHAAEQDDPIVVEPMVIKGDVLGKASAPEVLTYSGSRSVVDEQDLKKGSVRGLDESRSGRIQALSDGIPGARSRSA
ncbi:hypothetical protein WCE02_06365 [Pseudomonas juntendi]|uniref:hypothetical protein n=1 Tax=Pseudomonas TaxID=286 RepID=UPI00267AEE40